ncbi:MAG: hypothetical protein ACKOUT_09870 [Novosphingobium sp.]
MLRALPWILTAAALVMLYVMRKTDWRGDEYTYVAGARALGNWLAGRLSWTDAYQQVIGPGWFMPGASVIGAPLFALVEEPAQGLVRAWALAVNLTLFAAVIRAFGRVLGRLHGAMFLLFPMLVASWHVSLVTLMPDIPAGLLAALALLAAWRISAGKSADWKAIAKLELLLAAAIYLRGPMLLLALAVHGVLLAIILSRPQAKRHAGSILAGLIGLALILAPWSVAATRHFGEPVLTTTNVPLVFAESFGDPGRTCFGPCPAGQDIWPEWHYAQGVSQQTGENSLSVQRRMMTASITGLTPLSYLKQVSQHFTTFLFRPDGLTPMYMEVAYAVPPSIRRMLQSAVHWLTLIAYLPFVFALLAANILPFRRSDGKLLQGLLIKAGTAVLFLQPFFHHTSARYWQTFAPLAAWSAALLVTSLMRTVDAGPRTLPVWLDRVQFAYAGIFVAIAAALAVAGILA